MHAGGFIFFYEAAS